MGRKQAGSNKRAKLGPFGKEEEPARMEEENDDNDESDDGSDDEEYEEEELDEDDEEYEEQEEDLARGFYFFAKDHIDSGVCNTFPKALAALNRVKNMILDRNEDLRKLIQKALKRDANDTRVPPGSGSIQRTLTDERFFLCITNVLISKLQLAKGQSQDALATLREALIWFPRCIEANYLTAEILRSNASSVEHLQSMEGHLLKAIETGTHLREKVREAKIASKAAAMVKGTTNVEEDNEITEAELVMEIETEELVAAKKAQECLMIILCQSGRFAEAYPHLKAQGFKWRLSREVFNYPTDNTSNSASASAGVKADGAVVPYVRAFDKAVPVSVVSHLQAVFRPDSPYWSEHNYDTVINASSTTGYFSYLFPFRERSPVCSVEQIIQQYIYPAVCEQFPQAAEANYAEWWVHSRPHSNGHQLHYDSDETRIMSGRAPAHPIVSTVLCLNDGIGGPTVVTNQRLSGPLATEGYMVLPKLNRMAMFDAQYLHGVIPGRGLNPKPHNNERRLTFMVGFWKEIAAKDRGLDTAGPGQPFPDAARTKYTWPKEMRLDTQGEGYSAVAGRMEPIDPIKLGAIWEPIECGVEGLESDPAAQRKVPTSVSETPHYSTCFQGF